MVEQVTRSALVIFAWNAGIGGHSYQMKILDIIIKCKIAARHLSICKNISDFLKINHSLTKLWLNNYYP